MPENLRKLYGIHATPQCFGSEAVAQQVWMHSLGEASAVRKTSKKLAYARRCEGIVCPATTTTNRHEQPIANGISGTILCKALNAPRQFGTHGHKTLLIPFSAHFEKRTTIMPRYVLDAKAAKLTDAQTTISENTDDQLVALRRRSPFELVNLLSCQYVEDTSRQPWQLRLCTRRFFAFLLGPVKKLSDVPNVRVTCMAR